jgi:hypothetical protein
MLKKMPSIFATLLFFGCGEPGASTTASTTNTGTTGTTTLPTYDEGCILVDGSGGYAHLVDAVTVAQDDAVITLCDETVDESVTILNKRVSIVGAGTLWEPPTNTPAIIAGEGADVSLENVSILTTKAAVEAIDSAKFHIENADISFANGFGTYGITTINATVSASNVSITGAPWGAVRIDGGDFSGDQLTIDQSTAYGVHFDGGAVGTLTNSTITNTAYTDDGSGSIFDGVGLYATGSSSVTTDGNVYTDNIFAAAYAEVADISLNNDVADNTLGQYYGVIGDTGLVTLTNCTIANPYSWGVAIITGDLVLVDTDVSTSPELSFTSSIDKKGNISLGSMGIVSLGGTMDITGGSVSGFNSAGVWGESSGTDPIISIDGLVVDDNSERGLFVTDGELYATNTTVSNTHNNDEVCVDATTGSRSCNMAMFAINSTVTFGGVVTDNDDWGLTMINSDFTADNLYAARNVFTAIFGQTSSVSINNSTFEESREYALYLYDSSSVVQNSSFMDPSYTYTYENWDGKGGWVEYGYQAIDIFAYVSNLVVEDSNFINSDLALYVYDGSTATIRDSAFDGANQSISGYYGADIEVINSTFNDVGANTIYGYDSMTLYIQDSTFTDVHPYFSSTVYYYKDGSINSTYSYENAAPVIYASSNCSVEVEDVTMTTIPEEGIYLYEGDLEVDGLTISGISATNYSSGAIYIYNYTNAPDAEISNLTVDDVGYGDAVAITNYSAKEGLVSLTDISIGQSKEATSGIASYGIDAYSTGIEISGLEIANTGGAGINLYDTTATITGASASMSGTIENSGNYGIATSYGQSTFSDLAIIDAAASGLSFIGGVHSLNNVTVNNAAQYGMTCSGIPSFSSCTTSLDGALGDTNGACEECESL